MKKYFLLLFLLTFLFSCKTPPKVTAQKPKTEEPKTEEPKVGEPKTEENANKKYDFTLVDGTVDIVETDRGLFLVLENPILFEFRKYDLLKKYESSVVVVKNFMTENTNFQKMIVEGRTDKIGKAYPVNYVLSNKRSKTVIDAIVKLGISRSRLYQIGLGKAAPDYKEDDKNRRVNFIIIRNDEEMKKYEDFVKKLDLKSDK